MIRNILIILLSVSILYFLWGRGLEKAYAHSLKTGVNVCFAAKKDVKAEIKEDNGKLMMYLYYDKSGWREPLETIILPFIVLLSWQIFVFFHANAKKAAKIGGRNLLIFFSIQVLFLLLLYGMNSSDTAVFLFRLLKNSFGIVVLFMIIWDIIELEISFKNNPTLNKKSEI